MAIGGAAGAALVGLPALYAHRNPKIAGAALTKLARRIGNGAKPDSYRKAIAEQVRNAARLKVTNRKEAGVLAALGATAGAYGGAMEGTVRSQFGRKSTDIYNEYQGQPEKRNR